MHVSYQDDRGANSVELQGELCEGSLHHAWDECIIRESLGSDSSAIAAELRADISDADRDSWQFDAPVEWANESYRITIDAAAEYCTMREGACWYSANNMMLQRGEERRAVTFDRQYVATHRGTVETTPGAGRSPSRRTLEQGTAIASTGPRLANKVRATG